MQRTILTVDDHELVRLGLRTALARQFGNRFEVEEAASLEEALACLEDRVDAVLVVLLDLHLGDSRGLAGLRLLREHHPRTPVIVVSGIHDDRVRDEALMQGAQAYIRKTGDGSELPRLMQAIEAASAQAGEPSAGPAVAGEWRSRARLPAGYESRLGKRQMQVLELILAGHDNQAIVWETGLALGSVKNCVSSIFLVFNVRSRAELIGLFTS